MSKKTFTKIIALILCMTVLLQGCEVFNEPEKQVTYEFYYTKDYWELMPLEQTYFDTPEKLEQTIQNYITEIEEVLGISEWWIEAAPNAEKIGFNVQISGEGASWAYKLLKTDNNRTETTLIVSFGAGRDGIVSHELTHIMIDDEFTFSRSLEEGLCDYVQSQVGIYPDMEKYNWKLEEFLKSMNEISETKLEITDECKNEILDTIGIALNGYPYAISTNKGFLWYAYSQSFVTYLIEKYGMEDVVTLIKEGVDENSYKEYLGKSFSDIKKDWLSHYEELNGTISEEEINQAFLDSKMDAK